MDTNKLILKDEVCLIVGSAIEVLNGIGHGLHEKPYENSIVVEFGLRNIPVRPQESFDVLYKSNTVGLFRPDLIAYDSIIVDAKVIDRITDVEPGADAELFKDRQIEGRCDSQFQIPQARMGKDRPLIRAH